ncbi:MAG: hypothetical protein PHQ81_05025 [Methanofollis sp.]|nr:hypothetical protein [Methanofollis sp.]
MDTRLPHTKGEGFYRARIDEHEDGAASLDLKESRRLEIFEGPFSPERIIKRNSTKPGQRHTQEHMADSVRNEIIPSKEEKMI